MTDDAAREWMMKVSQKALTKPAPKHRRSEKKSRKRPSSAVATSSGANKKARGPIGGSSDQKRQEGGFSKRGRVKVARKRLGE